jgi:hypothetical protein
VPIVIVVILAFFVVLFGSVKLGRWMQRKGRELEKGPKG